MKFNIYAGLGGSMGGAEYKFTSDFADEHEALDEAYDQACADYYSYEGFHGIYSWADCACDYFGNDDIDFDEISDDDRAEIDEIYLNEIESWIDYYVMPTDEDPDTDIVIEER